jgi:hypothetical protein
MAVCVLHEAPRTGMPRALLPLNDDELAGLRPATTSDHRPNHRWAWEPAPPASGPPPTTPPARRSPRRPPSRLVGTPSPHGSCRGVHGVPCSSGTPSTASAVRFWWAGRIYPAPTSTTTPHRQSRSICRGGTCAARRPGREPHRPSSRLVGTPSPHGSCRGVHGVPCSSGTPSTASAVRFWWAGRIYPAPTSTTTPHRQSRSICRGGTCAARRPGREPRRPSSRPLGTPFPHGSCCGVHGAPCSRGTPPTAGAVRFWWAGRLYPAPTSTTTPHRQSRSVCRGGTCAARRPGREPRRPSSRPLGAPFPYGSCRGVHAVTAFKRRAASRRSCSTLVGGPDISGPYEYHPPPSTIRSCLQGRHVWRTNRKGAQISVPLREASCW